MEGVEPNGKRHNPPRPQTEKRKVNAETLQGTRKPSHQFRRMPKGEGQQVENRPRRVCEVGAPARTF